MDPVLLKELVDNDPQGLLTDVNEPFSYIEWKQRRPTLIEDQSSFHYNKYVLEWFQRNKDKRVSNKFLLRQKYLYLLDQLQLFFTDEEKNQWYNKINLANENELLLTIPCFARKLKQISLYYLNLRKKLKTTKLRYNTIGTSLGLEREIYNLILKGFSSNNPELDPKIVGSLTNLDQLKGGLVIQVEEQYDDKNYLDKSNTIPISSYFNIFHHPTEKYLQTKGISLSSDQWLFTAISLSAESNIDVFVSSLTGEIFETIDQDLYNEFVRNFLSENKFLLNVVSSLSTTEVYDVPIEIGSNYFYYPFGVIDKSQTSESILPKISLSSIAIEGAAAGTNLENSDTIFVKNGNQIKGAWLYFKQFENQQETLIADLKQNAITSFLFPYPGYGLSGADVEWSGASYQTTEEYTFLNNELKQSVDNAYWSQILVGDSTEPILINNSTLTNSGANHNKNPNFADQIYLEQFFGENTTAPLTDLSGAWLYEFEKMAWPIIGNSDNSFLFPYYLLSSDQPIEDFYKKLNFQETCDPISIQDFNSSFCIGFSSIEKADRIYKVNNLQDSFEEATECAWLSSSSFDNHIFYKSHKQNGFSALFQPQQITKFIWNGPNTPLSAVFQTIEHSKECPFVTNIPSVSAFEWTKCTCKQVYHTPFGHNGLKYEDNNEMSDFIVKESIARTLLFNKSSWRDSQGRLFSNSPEVAWYKTKKSIGWGDGQWITNNTLSSSPFLLETGNCYYYKRTNSRTEEQEFPAYSVNYAFVGNQTNAWIEAEQNEDASWKSTDKLSNMTVRAGDFLKFERQNQTTYFLASSELAENVSENRGSLWASSDYVALNSSSPTTNISWPFVNGPFLVDNYGSQAPPTTIETLSAIIAWKIQCDQNPSLVDTLFSPFSYDERLSIITYQNIFTFTFVPPQTGTYSISVTAVDNEQTFYFLDSTTIPKLSVVDQYTNVEKLVELNFPSSGFLLEQQLKGWDYNERKSTFGALGAKPYWATLYTDKQPETRFKGALNWGYPKQYINGYLPDTSPRLSPLELTYSTSVKYKRVGFSFEWKQPIIFKSIQGESVWCEISSYTTDFSNLSSIYQTQQVTDLNAIPTYKPTDIQLTNINNGFATEIYYYALNNFTWSISSTIETNERSFETDSFLISPTPWSNFSNRFYSTIAQIPVLEEIYSEEDVGGYFIPQNLGASQLINKDFSSFVKEDQSLSGSYITEDVDIHIGGRGRTQQDQDTKYDWSEQNQWLKNSSASGLKSETIKNELTRTLQTFVPYEENSVETSLGLVTPASRVSPWGGKYQDQWTDIKNEPKGFTGVRNVSAWNESQILKKNEQVVDCWVTDIYGNQYGLFKQLEDINVVDRRDVLGQLWLKGNDQMVNPASISLTGVFLSVINNSVYNELISEGIKHVDCFFDTLMIETSSSVVFFQLEYDYENSNLFSILDNTTVIENLNINTKVFDNTWFFPKNKTVTVLLTNRTNNSIVPELYKLDLNNRKYTKLFPLANQIEQEIKNSLSDIEAESLDRAVMHFNSVKQTYLITYKGLDVNEDIFFINFEIEEQENLTLKKLDKFINLAPAATTAVILYPPIVSDTRFLEPYDISSNSVFNIQISAENEPTSYQIAEPLVYPTINVTSQGSFTGTLSGSGLYDVNYFVSNQNGFTKYSLTLNII